MIESIPYIFLKFLTTQWLRLGSYYNLGESHLYFTLYKFFYDGVHVSFQICRKKYRKSFIMILYFSQAYAWSIAVTWPCYKFCYRPYYTKNRKCIDLTKLKTDFHVKILVLAGAALCHHNSEVNTYTLSTKYITIIRLKRMKRISFLFIIIKQLKPFDIGQYIVL